MAGGKRAGGNILTLFNHGLWQAKVYESKNDLPSAMRELKNAYALEPANHFVVLSLGSGYYKMGDLKAAEEKYREALAISPIYIDAYYNLGFLYNQEGRFEEAAAVLKKAVFLDSEDYGAHFELGRAYKAMGDHAGAGREFGLALKKINRWRASDRAVIEKELAGLAGR